MESTLLNVERTLLGNGGSIAQITISRREAMNALNREVLLELVAQ